MNERDLIERYNDAWNAHDLDAIASMHAPDIVFHNYSAGERAEGADAVREHIAAIFRNNPDIQELLNIAEPTPGAPDDQGSSGMPQNTTRNYTRSNESEATQGGQEQDMIQQMMGAGSPQAGDFGGGQ